MSVEFRDPPQEGEPSFLRPIDRHPIARRRRSPSAGSSHDYRRNPSLVPTNQMSAPPPPPEPIPVPSPVSNARGLVDEVEHMTVDPDDVEAGYGYHGKRKGFVGGFVSGLRKLPKVMMKRHTFEKSPVRQEAVITPYYNVRPPERLSGPANVRFAEENVEVPPSPFEQSAVHERVGSDSTEHDDTTTLVHDHEMSVVPPPPPIRPIIGSPVFSETSDYINNMPLRPHMRSDASLGAHLARLREVVSNLKYMPWMGQSRITLDYVPGETNRKRLYRGGAPMSWYPPLRPDSPLDLLEGASPPQPEWRFNSVPPHKRPSIPESPPHEVIRLARPPSPTGFPRPVYPHGYVPYASYQPESFNPPPPPVEWGQGQQFGPHATSFNPGFIYIPTPPNKHEPIPRPPPVQSA